MGVPAPSPLGFAGRSGLGRGLGPFAIVRVALTRLVVIATAGFTGAVGFGLITYFNMRRKLNRWAKTLPKG
jgi:hypothetical protein